MIPAGLAALQVAVDAWKASIGPDGPNSLADLDDETLQETYRAIFDLCRDVEDEYNLARNLVIRRVMAPKAPST